MAKPTTISEAIEQSALSPKRTKVGKTEVEEHDLDQLIRADNHTKASTAVNRNHMGLRFSTIVPPGAG